MLNRVSIMGRLTADPETRTTGNGTQVVSFSIACDRDYSGKEQARQTDFFTCIAWRYTADFIGKYFRKGDMIAVAGHLQHRKWEDKEGNHRSVIDVVVDNAYFTGSKKAPEPAIDLGKSYDDSDVPPQQQSDFSMLEDDTPLPF